MGNREQEGGFSDGGFEKHGMGGRVKAFEAFLHVSSSFSESGIVVAAILAIPEELGCTDFKQAWRRRCGSVDADGFDLDRKPRVAGRWKDGVWDLVVGRDAFFPFSFCESCAFATALLAAPDELDCTDFKAFDGDSESFVWVFQMHIRDFSPEIG